MCILLLSGYNNTIILLLEPFHCIFFSKSVLETDFPCFPSPMGYVKTCTWKIKDKHFYNEVLQYIGETKIFAMKNINIKCSSN